MVWKEIYQRERKVQFRKPAYSSTEKRSSYIVKRKSKEGSQKNEGGGGAYATGGRIPIRKTFIVQNAKQRRGTASLGRDFWGGAIHALHGRGGAISLKDLI